MHVSCLFHIQILSLFDLLSARLVRIQAHVATHGITSTSTSASHDQQHGMERLQQQSEEDKKEVCA